MIFMKFFARSSRATGPKMRVPRGLLVGVDDDDSVGVETQIAAVGAANRSLGANDNRFCDFALLHRGVGGAFLDVHSDDVAHVGVWRMLAFAVG